MMQDESIDEYQSGTTTGPADTFFIGLAHVDPAFDGAGEVLLPQIGLVIGYPTVVGKGQCFMGVQNKKQQTHHHALVGIRRVAGDGEAMIIAVIAALVGDLRRAFDSSAFRI